MLVFGISVRWLVVFTRLDLWVLGVLGSRV